MSLIAGFEKSFSHYNENITGVYKPYFLTHLIIHNTRI